MSICGFEMSEALNNWPLEGPTDEEFTNSPWMVLKGLLHLQVEVSYTMTEWTECAMLRYAACLRLTNACWMSQRAHTNSNGRCLAAKLFISWACRVKWFWFCVCASLGLGPGAAALITTHTPGHPPPPLLQESPNLLQMESPQRRFPFITSVQSAAAAAAQRAQSPEMSTLECQQETKDERKRLKLPQKPPQTSSQMKWHHGVLECKACFTVFLF